MNELVGKRLLPAPTLREGPQISMSSNLGLIFDKYSGQLECDGDRLKFDKKVAKDCIKKATRVSGALDPEAKERLKAVRQAIAALALKAGGCARDYVTDGPFVTGLGIETPLENGMALHPTLGVPYLPGSGVKGMARAFAEVWADPRPAEDDIARIFGPRLDGAGAEGAEATAGSIVFFDALPHETVGVEEDIMTPHYQDYYQKGDTPGDWLNPNPIPFFVVPEGVRFTFALAPRRRPAPGGGELAKRHEEGLKDLGLACGCLEEALAFLGAGAKTKSGYGRFRPA